MNELEAQVEITTELSVDPKVRMTASQIITSLMRPRFGINFCLPRYTPEGWWECDVFEVTRNGFWNEYEVKISRQDFMQDAQKRRRMGYWSRSEGRVVTNPLTKHERLNLDLTAATPKRFWYVTPVDLIQLEELPPFAGLIEVLPRQGWAYEVVRVQAPVRHSLKVNPQTVEHARGICYYRMHKEFLRGYKKIKL